MTQSPARPGLRRAVVGAALAASLAACVPVTVNISFPQEKLEAAARQIEDSSTPPGAGTASTPAATPAPAPGRAPSTGSQVGPTPRTDIRDPEVVKASQARRERRPALREWKNRGCIGETNQGLTVARPGEGCGSEVAALISAENADRKVIYDAFMKENSVPASDLLRVHSAFAKARQERSRPNDWIQMDSGQWVRKS